MKIAIVGTGYVGLVSGTCFAEMGLDVYCVDVDAEKINALNSGQVPIYEPGLEELVRKNRREGRLHFTTDLSECIDRIEILFIAVGTPPDATGSADLSYVFQVAQEVGQLMSKYVLVVTKSTVPVGTTYKIKETIANELSQRGVDVPFDVASNPEFLKEGAAIKDFMSPDRVVVGIDSEKTKKLMTKLYRPFLINNFRVIFMDILSSELTKYTANAMLATRISFMNEIANLCEQVGADVENVRKGIGSDHRIGQAFLYPGCGFGGSCFPKDVKAIAQTAKKLGCRMEIIEKVSEVNDAQKHRPFEKVTAHLGSDLTGKTIAVWGLAFKPETDDMREAPALYVIQALLDAGANVRAYDPVAIPTAQRLFPEDIYYAKNAYDAADGADAVILLTEWKQFRLPDWDRVRDAMRGRVVIDGRNIYVPEDLTERGFVYDCIGRPNLSTPVNDMPSSV